MSVFVDIVCLKKPFTYAYGLISSLIDSHQVCPATCLTYTKLFCSTKARLACPSLLIIHLAPRERRRNERPCSLLSSLSCSLSLSLSFSCSVFHSWRFFIHSCLARGFCSKVKKDY